MTAVTLEGKSPSASPGDRQGTSNGAWDRVPMSLTVLVTIVVAGITLVVVAVHLSGGSTEAKIPNDDVAKSRFAVDFEEEEVQRVIITADARTAFLLTASGGLGIVQSFGDKYLTRLAQPSDFARAEQVGENEVELQVQDFTWKGGVFRFDHAEAAQAVLERSGVVAADNKEIG